MYVCVCVCVCIYIEREIYTCMCVYVHIYIYIYTCQVNPLKKVPAFIDERGQTVFESAVILEYLQDPEETKQQHT